MSFKIGDVCVIVTSEFNPEIIGREVTIIRELRLTNLEAYSVDGKFLCAINGVMAHRCEVSWAHKSFSANGHFSFEPHRLRLKKPPNKDDAEPLLDFTPSDWSVGPFNPYKQRVRET